MVEIKAVYEGQLHCTATHGPSGMTLTTEDRKSTRLNSSHSQISYAVFCLKKKMIVNDLDLAIRGDGFFKIHMPDGTFAYTRNGSFQMDAQDRIVTAQVYPVKPTISITSAA